jgi:putative solute:sodium symporter small subunit
VLAPWLNQFRLGNAPLGFWFAQQGSIYVFILLIWIYARRMDTLDRQYDVHE